MDHLGSFLLWGPPQLPVHIYDYILDKHYIYASFCVCLCYTWWNL